MESTHTKVLSRVFYSEGFWCKSGVVLSLSVREIEEGYDYRILN
jgi:hypothetical protein